MAEWRTEDKEWKKARREEWNIIKDKIKNTTIDRKMVKYLKHYYMTGEILEEPGRPEGFCTFYKMWLHPNQSAENLQKIYEAIGDASDMYICHKLFKEFSGNTKLKLGEDGILGGNEETYTKILYPNIFNKDKRRLANGDEVSVCSVHAPSFFTGFCVMGAYLLLDEEYYKNIYSQFMIDFWFSVLPYGDLSRPEIDWLFRAVYCFDEVGVDDGPGGNRRRFAERMKEALDTRELPEALSEKWAWIKTRDGKIPTLGEAGLFKGWARFG